MTVELTPCPVCEFTLFNPIHAFGNSTLGLYDDARFPGRAILKLEQHYELLEDTPEDIITQFMADSRESILAIKQVTGVERVNFAILGNTVQHVHAHLIPRYPETETFPGKSPWNDPRSHTFLTTEQNHQLITQIAERLK